MTFAFVHSKNIIRPVIIAALMLLVPFISNFTVEGFNWTGVDFVFAFTMFLILCTGFELVAMQSNKITYRVAASITLLTTFALVWGNLAVGLIGSEDNPANALYMAVPLIGLIGAAASWLRAKGLSYTLFAMATMTALTAVIGLLSWKPTFNEPPGMMGVIMLNLIFIFLFTFSGILFHHASRD